MSVIELLELAALLRQVFKIAVAIIQRCDGCGRSHTDHPMRPEEVTLGIHHPPFTVIFLDTETSCCLQLRSCCPSSELRPVGWSRMLRQVLKFFPVSLLQVFIRLYLARPIRMFELSIAVYERKEILSTGLKHRVCRLSSSIYGLDIAEDNLAAYIAPLEYESDLLYRAYICIIGVQSGQTRVRRIPHKPELFVHLRMGEVCRERHLECPGLTGIQTVHIEYSPLHRSPCMPRELFFYQCNREIIRQSVFIGHRKTESLAPGEIKIVLYRHSHIIGPGGNHRDLIVTDLYFRILQWGYAVIRHDIHNPDCTSTTAYRQDGR